MTTSIAQQLSSNNTTNNNSSNNNKNTIPSAVTGDGKRTAIGGCESCSGKTICEDASLPLVVDDDALPLPLMAPLLLLLPP